MGTLARPGVLLSYHVLSPSSRIEWRVPQQAKEVGDHCVACSIGVKCIKGNVTFGNRVFRTTGTIEGCVNRCIRNPRQACGCCDVAVYLVQIRLEHLKIIQATIVWPGVRMTIQHDKWIIHVYCAESG